MKVTRNTRDQLIIAYTPWLIGLMLIMFILVFVGAGLFTMSENFVGGLFFTVMGGGIGFIAFAAFVRRTQLILDRPSDTVTIRTRSLFGYTEVRHALSDLSHAALESTTSSKGNTLHRPTLILDRGTSAGAHPLVTAYTNTAGPRRAVDAVNRWLKPNKP